MDTPHESSIMALNTATPNMADEPPLTDGAPRYSIDALNASTQHLADEHTLPDGTPITEQRFLEYQYTQLGRQTYFG